MGGFFVVDITGLAHIGVFVKDIELSKVFYQNLGFTVDREESVGETKLAFLSAGSCLIELVQKDLPLREAGPVDHIAFVVNDVDTAIKNAQAKGIEIDESTVCQLSILGGVKNVFFTGPDGERLEFFEYVR